MEIFPAIDLRNGKCVRLTQGDFTQAKIYHDDPVLQVQQFTDSSAVWLHVVDLDGAQKGSMCQLHLIECLAQSFPLKLQVGGGVRDDAAVKSLLDCGIERVVIGSLAVQQPALVKGLLRQFGPARIVVALDVRPDESGEPRVFTQAWQKESGSLWDVLSEYRDAGLKNVLCTDVSRDGMLAGPSLSLYQEIRSRWPELALLASGGVRNVDDLRDLANLGLWGAIVGKALYEGHFDLAGAIEQVNYAR
ncbi:MAG TPA: 1-(5-phosphoribosyl)-5-[(5-phosphoribosylamino)methylideneamino]imidazole-4-carboxamide isomerase [Rhizomicrobium sp.]|jgi:phosphoribosylformimino-5-aminoimidazole carboxamide ribotide isomerase|nr:1-(5-phosphoribosyl)-5-[(5-phosphoribosylamino)methylideneamino]imidazole-4-carboxamide isomerase [Rhizomicrobium sp.]